MTKAEDGTPPHENQPVRITDPEYLVRTEGQRGGGPARRRGFPSVSDELGSAGGHVGL